MTYQLKQTRYSDPDATSGQHTNGHANIFVREDDSCPWYLVMECKSVSQVRRMIEQVGLLDFQRKYCAKVGD